MEVYFVQAVNYRTTSVSGGRFLLSFEGSLEAHATQWIDLEVFSDDDFDLCCEATRDTLIRQAVQITTDAEPAVHALDYFDDTLVGSDCAYFPPCP